TKDFMQTLPFTRFGFNLYSEKEIVDLLKLNLFKIESITKLDEDTISKTGESVSRKSIIITCYKE
ncbi:MAG: SAM-dependent methyltransferase, partial [Bacilli bacterium]